MAISKRSSTPTGQGKVKYATSLDTRRRNIQTIQNERASPYVVSGLLEMQGIGSVQTSVDFPIAFVNKPAITFGSEWIAGSITPVLPPVISATLMSWFLDQRGPQDPNSPLAIFRGASIMVVASGPSNSHFYLHWSATGLAFRRAGGIDGQV